MGEMDRKKDTLLVLFIYAIILAIALFNFFFFTMGCASVIPTPTLTPLTTFKHDLSVDINGQHFEGTGIVNQAKEYKIKISPEDRIDRLILSTCHQEVVVDKPKTGWFNKSFETVLRDVQSIEDVSACALEIVVLNEGARRNGFATIEFMDTRPEVQLPALLKCNGNTLWDDKGVSICQAAFGLIQQITFSEPVVQTGSDPNCDVMKSKDDRVFTFPIPKGNCTYYFSAQRKIQGKRVMHRLDTIGYTDIVPRL